MPVTLSSLIAGAPSEITLTQQTRVDAAFTLAHPLKINGNGQELHLTQPLTYDPTTAGRLEIENAAVRWTKANVTGGQRAIVAKSGLVIRDCNITLDVTRGDSPPRNGSTAAFFLEVNAPNACGAIELSDNKVRGLASYGAGFVYGSNLAGAEAFVAERNDVEFVHGGFLLTSAQVALLSRNVLRRVSYANFSLASFGTVLLDCNQSHFPGNGTAGDNITIGSGGSITIKGHNSFGGSCYGAWILPSGGQPLNSIVVEDSHFTGGGTAGLRCTGESGSNKIGLAEFRRNVFSFNSGRGWEGRYIANLKMADNAFGHNNFTDADDGSQIAFLNQSGVGAPTIAPVSPATAGVTITEYANNRRFIRYTAGFYPVGDNEFPYVPI